MHRIALLALAPLWIGAATPALAQAMAKRGARLVLSSRRADALEAVARPLGAEVVPMDVADPASVAAAAAQVGEVDGLVWLAAVYWPMRAQD